MNNHDPITQFPGTPFMHGDPPGGFGVRFRVADDQSVYAVVQFDSAKEGGLGILHGGAVAAVMDEGMGAACYEAGHAGYTVTMTYNYKSHIPMGSIVTIRAWVDRIEGRKVYTLCEATLKDGNVAVDGNGLFIESEQLKAIIANNLYIPD